MVLANLFNVDPVKLQQMGKLDSVDNAQAVKFIDTGDDIPVFNLSEPRVRDDKFIIPFRFSNFAAVIFHLSDRYPKTAAQLFQLFA
ncbi:MAG: hypothetical protein A3H94_02170 [Acidobacteria bacterium RIFCSPLOWO2_02_FULL_60_20]|nr:MAG: hypothetical protein A3H94_02170 [Acidobacteria bacterium RIFCSPLOWO2_02_FULL_60_20]